MGCSFFFEILGLASLCIGRIKGEFSHEGQGFCLENKTIDDLYAENYTKTRGNKELPKNHTQDVLRLWSNMCMCYEC